MLSRVELLIGLACVLLFILILCRPWRIEGFTVVDVSNAVADDPATLLAAAYSPWRAWLTAFCPVWTEVLGKAKQADQSSQSDDSYIATLEEKHAVALYRCGTTWPAEPDLAFLDKNLPATAAIFQSTLTFMDSQIAKIKATTAAALQGKVPSGFADYTPSCDLQGNTLTCQFPVTIKPTPDATAAMIERLKKLNAEIETLQPLFQKVKQGIADLNNVGQQAQSGELLAAATPLA